ncbi:MAG: hypothetical protein DHS20C21_02670 [Gemmatimonadota bacterium]|nr:MAG: hypothetical protein DHS20C21_02670 [Gemmatimonadota bacterium]
MASSGDSACMKGASAATAGSKEACGAECAKACCAGAEAATITYSVAGMTCMGCVNKVEAAVAGLEIEGLESVTVNMEGGNAVLTTTGPVDVKAIEAAITESGFKAEFASVKKADTKAEATKEAEESAATN